MHGKTERFEMRLDQETLDKVDDWRSSQDDVPTRSEAIRRLIEVGLSYRKSSQLKFSDGEKLILFMLSDVAKKLKAEEIDPKFVESALAGGHYWAFDWKYQGIFHDHVDNKRIVNEVCDILDMWSFIETSYAKLSKKDKERIANEGEPLGKHVSFFGFDGNYETEHLGIAAFLIRDMGRFEHFKGRELNSHLPSLAGYRRMYKKFEPMRPTFADNDLSADTIIELLNAWRHPEQRHAKVI